MPAPDVPGPASIWAERRAIPRFSSDWTPCDRVSIPFDEQADEQADESADRRTAASDLQVTVPIGEHGISQVLLIDGGRDPFVQSAVATATVISEFITGTGLLGCQGQSDERRIAQSVF